MQKLKILIMLISFIGGTDCHAQQPEVQLQPGDLLFRGAAAGNLSEAIDKVTQTEVETHFSHVGLVEHVDGSIFVLHADPKGGTCRVLLQEFLQPEKDSVEVVAYRLKPEWQSAVPEALGRARDLLGKPYNFSYILSDTAHYCSEFVHNAFTPDSIFQLSPMTFKDPETGNFFPTWVDYYQKLELDVPEGMPGCNPNGMAASDKLERLGEVK
ncbi:MAG: YiiX/YebB-like N1pC/P60 family cysteine hydrolase [Mangrovibacterium sp.]